MANPNQYIPHHARHEAGSLAESLATARSLGVAVRNRLSNRRFRVPTPLSFNVFESKGTTDRDPDQVLKYGQKAEFPINEHRASARTVRRTTGLNLGPLVRTVQLPAGPTERSNDELDKRNAARRIYLFDRTRQSYGQQEQAAPELMGLGLRDIEKLRRHATSGNYDGEITDELLDGLNIKPLRLKPGESRPIGRLHWTPIARGDEGSASRVGLPNVYGGVGNNQGAIELGYDGTVTVINEHSNVIRVSSARPPGELVTSSELQEVPSDPWGLLASMQADADFAELDILPASAWQHIPQQRTGHPMNDGIMPAPADPWSELSETIGPRH